MRREGYEFQVSRPEVIYKEDEEGNILEPFEEVQIETSSETTGTVVEMLGQRRGKMMDMHDQGDNTVRLTYIVPTRGMLGFRYQFLTATRGLGVMNTLFHGYDKLVGGITSRQTGSLVAWETGTATNHGLKNAEDRGVLFISAGEEVYEGMVVGEYAKSSDLTINVCKKKQLTNMRQSNRDIEVRLTTPRQMSLDEKMEYLAEDDLLEVTPQNIRIRKRILDSDERGKLVKKAKEDLV
jgi:GTP-binding protein